MKTIYLIGFILAVCLAVYSNRQRSWLDRLMAAVVVIIAGVVALLSFHNTVRLAQELKLNPYLTAGLVELLFTSLLGIRARQRATQRNVPRFIHVGFFISFIFVTLVNMYGLAKERPIIGAIVGLAISGAMWLMESTLVWLWTESHLPHRKSLKELEREAKREIKKMKALQRIEWMKWEALKPDLDLIREAREAEEEREEVVSDGLPEYFCNKLDIQPKVDMIIEKVDAPKVDVVMADPEKVDVMKVDVSKVDIYKERMQKVDVKVDTKVDAVKVDVLQADKVDVGKVDAEVDMSKVDASKVDVAKVAAVKEYAMQVNVKEVDTTKVDMDKVDMVEVDTQKVDTTNVDVKKVDKAKVDMEEVDVKVDTEEVDTDKVDLAKVDTEKVDTQKVDVKVDVEKVDTSNVIKFPNNVNVDAITLEDAMELAKDLNMTPETLEEMKRVLEYAFQVKDEKKKFPGRKKLKQETQCSEYIAKEAARILNTLKKKQAS